MGLANADDVVGRTVLEWHPNGGTYGMGGYGFVCFKLDKKTRFHKENWLCCTIFAGASWMLVNGKHLENGAGIFDRNKSLYCKCMCEGKIYQWDDFSPLVLGQKINHFSADKKSSRLVIGETEIIIPDDPSTRPWYIEARNAEVGPRQSIAKMWILSRTDQLET